MTRQQPNMRPIHQLVRIAHENQLKDEILALARSYYGTLSGATHRYDVVIHKRHNDFQPGIHFQYQVTLIQHHGGGTVQDPGAGRRASTFHYQLYRSSAKPTRLEALEYMREELQSRLDAEMESETGNEVRTFIQKLPPGGLFSVGQPLR